MKSGRDFLVVTNNPLAVDILGEHYQMNSMVGSSYRDVLVYVRDMIHLGHTLHTHPLSGSVKPNETPYKSVVISKSTGAFSMDQGDVIASAIQAFDKFTPREIQYSPQAIEDFQLIDYTLLAGALDFDAVAGLNQRNK